MALIELSSTPPASWGVEYAGWDATGATPTSAVGIHHPSGDVKKICFEENSPYYDVTGGAQVWWIDQWELGVTEPGSSGSPFSTKITESLVNSTVQERLHARRSQQWRL